MLGLTPRWVSFQQRLQPWTDAIWDWLYQHLPNRFVDAVRHFTPSNDFITYHYAYFLTVTMIGGLIIWGSADPYRSLAFIDSYYLAVSAMTLAGMNTVGSCS